MSNKLITLALLPYSQAELLRTLLKDENISCTLENVNVIQGAVSTGVKIKIYESDVERAWPIVDKFLGKKNYTDFQKDNSVVALVDFSAYSFKAALTAFNLAHKFNAKLILYHVINQLDFLTVPYSEVMAMNAEYFENMKLREEIASKKFATFLQELSQEVSLKSWNEVDVQQMIKIGYPADDILNFIDENPPRLVVMGSKGPDGNDSVVVGSTTAEVIYKSKVPVLVIPMKAKPLNWESKINLVYTTNFDKKDLLSISKLIDLSKPFDVNLSCVHISVVETNKISLSKFETLKKDMNERYADVNVDFNIVEGNDYLQTLDKYVQNNNVDVVSLTTHRRNLLTGILNPSITKALVFHSNTPLLVFHS